MFNAFVFNSQWFNAFFITVRGWRDSASIKRINEDKPELKTTAESKVFAHV